MSEIIEEVIYIGRDNPISLILEENGVPTNLTAVTQVELRFGGYSETQSDNNSDTIKWAGALATGELILRLGNIVSLREGTFFATIVVTDPDNPNGLTWIDERSPTKLKFIVVTG